MIARALVGIVLLGGLAAAGPTRRPVPGKVAKAAGEAFARAVEAERAGKLSDAIAQYNASLELSPHPNTMFNKAEVELRLGLLVHAIASYEAYLALLPDAPDRRAIEASIRELRKRPATLEIGSAREPCLDLAAGYLLVDGALVRKPGVEARTHKVSVPQGEHTIDLVTSLGFASAVVTLVPGGQHHEKVCGKTTAAGTVVIQPTRGIHVTIEGQKVDRRGDRVEVLPGRRRAMVSDRGYECPPISIEVPKDGSIAYVHIAPAELVMVHESSNQPPYRCRKLTVKQHRLAF